MNCSFRNIYTFYIDIGTKLNIFLQNITCNISISSRGRRVIGISGSLIWSKTLMELIFYPCGQFRLSPESPVCQIHSPHILVGAPGTFSDLLKSVQILKREWGAESNGELLHLFIRSKTASQVPEFAKEDLRSGRIAALVPEFAVKDLPLGRTLMMMKQVPLQYKMKYLNFILYFNMNVLYILILHAIFQKKNNYSFFI